MRQKLTRAAAAVQRMRDVLRIALSFLLMNRKK
jgi:hypothetical protein